MAEERIWTRIRAGRNGLLLPSRSLSWLYPASVLLLSVLLWVSGSSEAGAPPEVGAVGVPGATVVGAPDIGARVWQGLEHTAEGDLEAADATWQMLRRDYPEHPAGYVYALDTLHWRKYIDFSLTIYDDEIRSRADRAVELSKRWLKRSPNDLDALYYCGQALFALVQLEGMQGHYYRAGKRGEEARKLLERALELKPDFEDVKLALGSYYYYASIATRYIRWLSWHWFVPTGEHDLGLAYVNDAARSGHLRRFEAQAALARMYMYMEERPDLAEPIVRRLAARYPSNSYLQFELVELLLMLQDYPGTIEAALALEATTGDRYGDAERRRSARIWRARAELAMSRVEEAKRTLAPLELEFDQNSVWSQRWILLARGHLHDLAGRREQAIASYQGVLAARTRWGSTRPVQAAKLGIKTPYTLRPAISTR